MLGQKVLRKDSVDTTLLIQLHTIGKEPKSKPFNPLSLWNSIRRLNAGISASDTFKNDMYGYNGEHITYTSSVALTFRELIDTFVDGSDLCSSVQGLMSCNRRASWRSILISTFINMTDLSRSRPVSSIWEIIGGNEPKIEIIQGDMCQSARFLSVVDSSYQHPPNSTLKAARVIILLSQTADSLMDGKNLSIDSTANL